MNADESERQNLDELYGRDPMAIPMRRQTMGVQIRAFLRREIITGHLPPRTALSEQELAKRFEVSRTPVREALIKLADENLVETFPQYGSFVSPITLSDVLDNQFVREAIECSAIERAIERVGEEQAKTMMRIMDRQTMLEATGDEEGFFQADEQLHEYLLMLAGHPQAWRVVVNAKAQLDRVRHLIMRRPTKLSSVIAEHRVIVERVIAGDRAGAVEAMRAHLRGVFLSIAILERENPDYFTNSSGGGRGRPSGNAPGRESAATLRSQEQA